MESIGRSGRRVGAAVVGLGGAVATTAAAGVELMRRGAAGTDGLPLAGVDAGLAGYDELVFGGWDFYADDLLSAARHHGVLPEAQLEAAAPALAAVRPWPAVGNARFCRNVTGENRLGAPAHAEAVEAIRADLRRFRVDQRLDAVVVVNLASTEASADPRDPVFATPESFRAGIEADHPDIGPAMLYAYAAILEGVPYANFTPSLAADVPALLALAERLRVPVCGKDGKTGQTFLKTVLAPALRDRALRVDGWFSTNILGNRDGEALRDPTSLASKLGTKGSVLDQILGYEVEDHVVAIHYYRPRGDDKEAWDNVDLTGFLGQRMQVKVNFLCKDSVLAAPLVIELVRLMELAARRGECGAQEQLGVFFKSPATRAFGARPEHAFGRQQEALLAWLASAPVEVAPPVPAVRA